MNQTNGNHAGYTTAELGRWHNCYHEAGHAVVTTYYFVEHYGGSCTDVAEKLVMFNEPSDVGNDGAKVDGYYMAKEHVRKSFSDLKDHVDVYLAGFAGEQLNPFDSSIPAVITLRPTYDLASAFRACEAMSKRSSQAKAWKAIEASRNRLTRLIHSYSARMAIDGLAKHLYASKDETTDGPTVDAIISDAFQL